jgi:hypothetical protein
VVLIKYTRGKDDASRKYKCLADRGEEVWFALKKWIVGAF